MRINTLVTLGASAAFGIIAILLARGWIESAIENEFSNKGAFVEATAQPYTYDKVPVLVADVPLNFGDTLTRENLRLIEMPEETVPEGAYTSFEELFLDPSQQTVVLTRMSYNEPIIGFKISGPGGRGSLSSLIARGKRATAIRVTDVAGVAGFVLPGDSVDIIYTRDEANRRGGDGVLLSDVLLQNIRVLGVDQDLSEQSSTPNVVSTITVEVSNHDAQKLHLAMDAGRLSLTLRRVGETVVEQEVSLSSKGLASAPKRKPNLWKAPLPAQKIRPIALADKVANITIIRGEDRNEVNVVMENIQSSNASSGDLNLLGELAGG